MKYFLVIKLVIKSLKSQLYFINVKLRIVQIYLILISIILRVENYFIANFELHLRSELNIYLHV